MSLFQASGTVFSFIRNSDKAKNSIHKQAFFILDIFKYYQVHSRTHLNTR
jgi:hypothetical protein